MKIPLKTPIGAVLPTFVRRKLEVEDLELPDYERPLWKAPKKNKQPWTVVSAYAFGKEVVRGLLP